MLRHEEHPFNDNIGYDTIKPNVSNFILGSFPAYEVVNNQNPRLNFYYGSGDNRFWEIVKDVLNADFNLDPHSIKTFLDNKFSILDIIEHCYCKKNRSSSDNDLVVLKYLDFPAILQRTNCRNIYTTGRFVASVMRRQISTLATSITTENLDHNGFHYARIDFKFFEDGPEFRVRLFTLISPSRQGLRGVQAWLNRQGIQMTADAYRREQYLQLLTIPDELAVE